MDSHEQWQKRNAEQIVENWITRMKNYDQMWNVRLTIVKKRNLLR